MKIERCGSRPSLTPPASYFSGSVRQDPLIEAPAPARVRAVTVGATSESTSAEPEE